MEFIVEHIPMLYVLCGVIILLWIFVRMLRKRKRCTLQLTAKCIEHKKKHDKFAYTPVYEIPWKNGTIQIHNGVYIHKIGKIRPAVGEVIQLHVNPDNPLEFYSPFELQNDTAPILVALIFIVMPLYFMYFY